MNMEFGKYVWKIIICYWHTPENVAETLLYSDRTVLECVTTKLPVVTEALKGANIAKGWNF